MKSINFVNLVSVLVTHVSTMLTVWHVTCFTSSFLPSNDVMTCVVILSLWLISVTTLLASCMMVVLTLVKKNLITHVFSVLTLFQVSQSTDPSVLTISMSISLSNTSKKNLSRTLWHGLMWLCLSCTVCQVQLWEITHKNNWWKLLSCMTSIKVHQQLYHLMINKIYLKKSIIKSIKSFLLHHHLFWQSSQCQSILPSQKSVSLSVTNRISLSQTSDSFSTSRTWKPVSTSPTSPPHLTLTKSSKWHPIDLSQWLASFTLNKSTHWPVLSTKWLC